MWSLIEWKKDEAMMKMEQCTRDVCRRLSLILIAPPITILWFAKKKRAKTIRSASQLVLSGLFEKRNMKPV